MVRTALFSGNVFAYRPWGSTFNFWLCHGNFPKWRIIPFNVWNGYIRVSVYFAHFLSCSILGGDYCTLLTSGQERVSSNVHVPIHLNIMFFFATDGKISIRINLPLFSTVLPSKQQLLDGRTVENKGKLIPIRGPEKLPPLLGTVLWVPIDNGD